MSLFDKEFKPGNLPPQLVGAKGAPKNIDPSIVADLKSAFQFSKDRWKNDNYGGIGTSVLGLQSWEQISAGVTDPKVDKAKLLEEVKKLSPTWLFDPDKGHLSVGSKIDGVTDAVAEALAKSADIADDLDPTATTVKREHLMLALLEQRKSRLRMVLSTLKVDPNEIAEQVTAKLNPPPAPGGGGPPPGGPLPVPTPLDLERKLAHLQAIINGTGPDDVKKDAYERFKQLTGM